MSTYRVYTLHVEGDMSPEYMDDLVKYATDQLAQAVITGAGGESVTLNRDTTTIAAYESDES